MSPSRDEPFAAVETVAPAPAPAQAVGEPAPLPGALPVVFGAKRAIGIFMAFWAIQAVAASCLAILAAMIVLAKGEPTDALTSRVSEGPILVGILLLATVVATYPLLRMLRRTGRDISPTAPLATVGWTPASVRACVSAAGQGLGLIVAFVLVSGLLPGSTHQGPLTRAALAGGWSRALWAVMAVLVAPPTEELLFRGVLYTGLARSWRPAVAGVVTTLAFVAVHITEVSDYWPAWVQIGIMGTLALRARVRTGSLIPGVMLHASYNLGLVLLTYALSATH